MNAYSTSGISTCVAVYRSEVLKSPQPDQLVVGRWCYLLTHTSPFPYLYYLVDWKSKWSLCGGHQFPLVWPVETES